MLKFLQYFKALPPIFLFISVLSLYSFFSLSNASIYTPTSPDENQVIFFSKNFAENFSFIYKNDLNIENEFKIFTPRNYVQHGNNTVPGGFIGFPIISALFYTIHPYAIFLISPLFGTLSLMLFYSLIKTITSNRIAFIMTFLLSIFPPFFFWATMLFNNMAEVFFVLLCLFAVFKLLIDKNNDHIYLPLSILAAIIAVWIRYIDALFFAIIYLNLFIFRRFQWKVILYSLMITVIFAFPFFIANNLLYGSYFTSGPYSKDLLVYNDYLNLPKQIIPFVPFRSFEILFTNTKVYLLNLLSILIVFSTIGMFLVRKNIIENNIKIYLSILIQLTFFWILYYVGGSFSGYSEKNFILNSSYTRYFLIPYILVFVFMSLTFYKLKNLRKYLIVFLCFYIPFSFETLFASGQSVIDFHQQELKYNAVKKDMLSKTEKDSIIFTKYYDKILYPERNVALYLTIKADNRVSEATNLAKSLIEKKIPVYWIDESWFNVGPSSDVYFASLEKAGVTRTLVDRKNGIYKLTINK